MLLLSLVTLALLLPLCAAFGGSQSYSHVTKRAAVNMLAVGDVAPDFEMLSSKGNKIKLSAFKNKKPVVVFFYPGDNSPGCTKEVCAFERKAPDFKSKGAEVFGVSSGSKQDKDKFVAATKINFELLIDEGDKVRKAWGVPRALFGAFPGRVTYVIGKDGTVKSIYDDLANAEMHPEKALQAL